VVASVQILRHGCCRVSRTLRQQQTRCGFVPHLATLQRRQRRRCPPKAPRLPRRGVQLSLLWRMARWQMAARPRRRPPRLRMALQQSCSRGRRRQAWRCRRRR
jgi:hypothetical protein